MLFHNKLRKLIYFVLLSFCLAVLLPSCTTQPASNNLSNIDNPDIEMKQPIDAGVLVYSPLSHNKQNTVLSNRSSSRLNTFSREIVAISAGDEHALALANDGTVWSWGKNTYGQLGNGTTTTTLRPIQVESLSGIIAISAGEAHSLALCEDGTVWAWGDNASGQLGDGTITTRTQPVQVLNLTDVIAVSAGSHRSIAIC